MITVKAKDFYKALHAVKQTQYYTIPILNHALIKLTDNGMIVRTTDLETPKQETVTYWGNGERWETCVPMTVKKQPDRFNKWSSPHKFHPFHDFMRVMAEYNETLEIEFNEKIQTLVIHCGKSRSEFKCMDAFEFPTC